MSVRRSVACVVLLTVQALAAAGPEFEVASLRPSADGPQTIGVHIDGAQVRMTRTSVKQFVGVAYADRQLTVGLRIVSSAESRRCVRADGTRRC